jgi:hypothetical protein
VVGGGGGKQMVMVEVVVGSLWSFVTWTCNGDVVTACLGDGTLSVSRASALVIPGVGGGGGGCSSRSRTCSLVVNSY